MPYRVHASQIASAAPEPGAPETLWTADASGRPGRAGARGLDGGNGSYGGANGGRGGDAGPPSPGEPAGSVVVTLASAEDPGIVRIGGSLVLADGRKASLGHDLAFGAQGFVELRACGGSGGTGGSGGDGGDGARGHSGADATRFSSGTDGGRGGDGGDGGNATAGAPGGSGGQVRVVVHDGDTHLLMLVRSVVSGGSGGAAGSNGRGGSGGPGGPGGGSYSWTTTETIRDAQGNVRTETQHHSNPGGHDGPPGSPGRPGSARVRAGADGKSGRFTIEVADEAGSKTFPSRYDLALVGFEHRNDNDDGIYEPGELVHVRGVTVRNAGGMPTPAHREVKLSLQQQGWIVPEGDPLALPRALEPGESQCFEREELRFRIGDYRPYGPEAPLECPEVIRQRASVPAVCRDFERYESAESERLGQFLIRFPARTSPLASLNALGPDEATRVRFSVQNISTRELGASSPSGRVLRVRLFGRDSELGDEHVALLDDRGVRVPLGEGMVREIPVLGPSQVAAFEATLGVQPEAPTYRSANLWLGLELGGLDEPGRARFVQYAARNVRVGRRYQPSAEADVLLVVNHRTTRPELDAWQQQAASLGLELNVWDLSVEGELDLEAEVGGAPLLQQLAGSTLVLLNNAVETPSGESRPARFLEKRQLFEADAAGVNVAVVGGSWDLPTLLVPTHDEGQRPDPTLPAEPGPASGTSPAAKPSALRGRAEVASPEALLAELGRAKISVLDLPYRARVAVWHRFFSEPRAAGLERRARRLQDRLQNLFPHRRFVVVHDYAPALESKFLWMKRYRWGALEVRPTLDAAAGRLLNVVVDDAKLHDPSYVGGPETAMTLLLTRGFDAKLGHLDELLGACARALLPGAPPAPPEPAGAIAVMPAPAPCPAATRSPSDSVGLLAEAMLVDLCNEQCAVLGSSWRAGLSTAGMMAGLPLLGQLGAFRLGSSEPVPADSPHGKWLCELAARLLLFSDSRVRLWERLPPWRWLRRAPALRWLTRHALAAFVRNVFGGSPAEPNRWHDNHMAAQRLVRRSLAQHRLDYRKARRAMRTEWATLAAHAEALLRKPIAASDLTTDAEVLCDPAERTFARGELERRRELDHQATRRRRRLMRAADQASVELRLERRTSELLGASVSAEPAAR